MILMVALVYSCSEEVQESTATTEESISNDQRYEGNRGGGETDDPVIGVSCIHNLFPGLCGVETILVANITLPQYPGCTFTFQMTYVKCTVGAIVETHFGDFTVQPTTNCPQYVADVNNAIATNTLDAFAQVFNKSVWKAITTYYLDHIETSPTSVIGYNPHSCMKTCFQMVNRGDYSGYIPRKYVCADGCCKVKRNYQKVNNEWVLVGIVDESSTITTNCQDPVVILCPAGTTISTNCMPSCDELLF